jgi:hypothetical protein
MPRRIFDVVIAAVSLVTRGHPAAAIRPKFSWDYVGNMTFVHLCNESGLFNDQALEAITRFPLVTVEKGQGFSDGTGVSVLLLFYWFTGCQLLPPDFFIFATVALSPTPQ